MDIKSLPQDVRKYLRSGIVVNSVEQCVIELVLNSLDAKSSSIAVRVNLQTLRLQVVDNGNGISMPNMNFIGICYMTSKCQSIGDLKKIKSFGFRGESLAHIRNLSKKVVITSRPRDIENTYSKIWCDGKWNKVEIVKQRPSPGTTVTVEGFLYNMPVRQKRINESIDLRVLKRNLECLAIINPTVSFNLRNDASGKIIFHSNKVQTVLETLISIYPDIVAENLIDFKIAKSKIKVSGLLYKGFLTNNKVQLLYLNKRPIASQKIQNLIHLLLLKSQLFKDLEKSNHLVYIMNISCPYSEIDLMLSPSKRTVEFKRWDIILACVKKVITHVLKQEKLIDSSRELSNVEEEEIRDANPNYRISQMKDAVKSAPVKRKKVEQCLKTKEKLNVKDVVLSKDENEFRKPDAARINNKITVEAQIHQEDCYTKVLKKKKFSKDENEFRKPDAARINNKITVEAQTHQEDCNTIDWKTNKKRLKSIIKSGCNKNYHNLTENNIDYCDLNLNKNNTKDNDEKHIPTLFNKHFNTQSLVLNSKLASSKPTYSWWNSFLESNDFEDMKDGKKLIMDMFLKSTVIYPNEKTVDVDNTKRGILENKKKKHFIEKHNTTMMTMSLKFLTKHTVVTNDCDDQTNNGIKRGGCLDEHQKVSKCIQTTMIEHQNEFELNFNSITGGNLNWNSDFYKLADKNLNVTVSKVFNQFSRKNFYSHPDNYRNYSNYFTYDTENKNFFDCLNPNYKHRRPMKKYVSDYNMDFANFNKYNEPYQRFLNNLNNYHYSQYLPSQNYNYTIPGDWLNGNVSDFTIPLYQTYNPYRLNPTVTRLPLHHKQNNYILKPAMPFDNSPFVEVQKPIFSNWDSFGGFDKHVDPNVIYPSIDSNMFLIDDSRKYHKRRYENAHFRPYITSNDGIYSPYFKHPKEINRRGNTNADFKMKLFTNNCTSPYFQKPLKNNFFGNNRRCSEFSANEKVNQERINFHKNQIPTYVAKDRTFSHEEDNYSPPSKHCKVFQPELIQNHNVFPLVNDHVIQNKPHSMFQMKNDEYSRHLKTKNPVKRMCTKLKCCLKRFNTEPNYSNLTRDDLILHREQDQTKKFKMFSREFNSESLHSFGFDKFVNHNCNNQIRFATPDINNSVRTTNEPVEEINLEDSFDTNSTVSFEKFNPRLSSTQRITNDHWVDNHNSDSNVVDETLNKDLPNFFVPSLNLFPQNPINSDFFQNSSYFNNCNKPKVNSKVKCDLKLNLFETECNDRYTYGKEFTEPIKLDLKQNTPFDKNDVAEAINKVDAQKEWVRKIDNSGNAFYIHKRSGMTSKNTPKQATSFNFVKRLEFVPKGLSPVFVETRKVNKSLSPASKKSLYATIMENYENELNVIKWTNYIGDSKDANKFFEALYSQEAKKFENIIPNANINSLPKSMIRMYSKSHGHSFTKDIFKKLYIIGQLDNKFIVALSKLQNLIILFDQHAVHERIRLETLLDEYTEAEDNVKKFNFKSVKCAERLNFMEIDTNVLINSKNVFEDLGFSYSVSGCEVNFKCIPLCVYNRFVRNKNHQDGDELKDILTSLIYEVIGLILTARGAVTKVPNILQNIINSEACRGAIKFGTPLTINECEEQLNWLSECNAPFQCAHGRPTLVPLIDVNNRSSKHSQPNLKKLFSM